MSTAREGPSVRRLFALVAVLAALGCHKRLQRPAGDEARYPPIDREAQDTSASPCLDFYQYACGGWLAQTPLPADRTSWALAGGEAEERNLRLLRRILEDAVAGKVDARDRFGRKMGDFYAACMDEATVEARGRADLEAEWARFDAISDLPGLGDELSRLEAMGLSTPFALRAEPDPTSSGRMLLVLRPGEQDLPADPAPDEREDRSVAYARYVAEELRLAGMKPERAEADAADALSLMRALAEARQGGPVAPAPERLDAAGLSRLAPSFPFGRVLRGLGADRLEAVGIADRAFTARVGELFAEAPLSSWKAYLRLRVLATMAEARALPGPMVQAWFRFKGGVRPAASELRPRWKHCVAETARAFELAAGNAFARKHLGPAGRGAAARVVTELQEGLRAAVEAAPWMDTGTRAGALAKIDRMVGLVGYSESSTDYQALRVGRESYFRNLLSARRFEIALEVARAGRPLDRGEWLDGPFGTAVVYRPGRNMISVPAGALEPPLYDREAPPPVVYGSLGTAVGRALAEALQGEGRYRGPDGGELDWWTPAARAQFDRRGACLVDQFGAYRASSGVRLDGERAFSEVLAEATGVRAAYQAMMAERAAHPGTDRKLFGYTPDQQFFLSYAQASCTASTEQEERAQVAGGHPPAHLLVNGTLSDMPEFARAFRCDQGSPMGRPAGARCDLW
ncbi:MAG TPA: M13 family metallopeptidase [Anaeromyxobacter sp.]|nr:M13 family metallopeptidase [Anaeromyxobacter sp.]